MSRANSAVQIQYLLLTLRDASTDVGTQESEITTVTGKLVNSPNCCVPVSHRMFRFL